MKFAKLIFKNLLRNKRRSFLTISSLVVSLFLVISLATIITEFTRATDKTNPLRLVTRHSVALTFSLPIAYRERIAALPGVQHVTSFSWFGGIYKEPKNFFANFAIDAPLLRAHMPEFEMPDAQWAAFINDRQGALVGRKLAEIHGFQIGQRVTLDSSIYNLAPEMIIRGIYTGGEEKILFFHFDYLNEMLPATLKDRAGTFQIMAKSAADVPKISQAVDSMFLNSDAPTKTETEKEYMLSFQSMMGSVKQFIFGIIGAIVFSLILVMANTMSMNVRERTKEVGTLKALGFHRGTIAWLFVGEAVVVAVIGGGLGVGLAALVFYSIDLGRYMPNFSSFSPLPSTMIAAFLASIVVGVISVIFTATRVSGMSIADALRSTE